MTDSKWLLLPFMMKKPQINGFVVKFRVCNQNYAQAKLQIRHHLI